MKLFINILPFFFLNQPIILPGKEKFFDDRFSISQLYLIIEELKAMANEHTNLIENTALLLLFNRKTVFKIFIFTNENFYNL